MSTEVVQTSQSSHRLRSMWSWFTTNSLERAPILYWAALLTCWAAILHFESIPAQLSQSILLALALLGCAAIQVAGAFFLITVPTRRIFSLVMIINGIAVLLWLIARITGLPVGLILWRPEMLTVQDFFLPIMEGLAALLLLRLVTRRHQPKPLRRWRTALAVLPVFCIIIILTMASLPWPGGNSAEDEVWLPLSETIGLPANQATTIAYCSPGGNPLAMDVFEPPVQALRPAPMVVFIHGGGGIVGTRKMWGDQDGVYTTRLRDDLLNHGFVVSSIDYRLAPLYSGQEAVEDVKCAVRFLRTHATELGIDQNRIGAYGSSQGGYLVAMLGTATSAAGFDVGQYLDQSSRLQAAVDVGGPTDFTNPHASVSWASSLLQILFRSSSTIVLQASSPLTYVASGDPSFLVFHGTDDPFKYPLHSQELVQSLNAVGVPATLVLVQHGGDGLNAVTAGEQQQPTPDALVQMISDFFAKTLRKS